MFVNVKHMSPLRAIVLERKYLALKPFTVRVRMYGKFERAGHKTHFFTAQNIQQGTKLLQCIKTTTELKTYLCLRFFLR